MPSKENLTTTSFRLSDSVRSQLKILEGELYSQGVRKANDVLKYLIEFYSKKKEPVPRESSTHPER
jgi:hypothetical protein